MLEDKGNLYIDVGAKKKSSEIIKESAFGWTYFRDIYSSANGKW